MKSASVGVGAAWLVAAAAVHAQAGNCDAVVASIESRIRANGVSEFSVTAVDAAASAPGRQVGTCDAGRKKILYLRGAAVASPPASSPSPRASRPKVITECADGRILEEGTCDPKKK